jgi:hypothetical protein
MSKQYRVAVVGIGAVGAEMIRVLRQRAFPCEEIRVLATRERDEVICGETFHVLPADHPKAFEGINFAFFAGTEGVGLPDLRLEGCRTGHRGDRQRDDYCIDLGVPLVILRSTRRAGQSRASSRTRTAPPSSP